MQRARNLTVPVVIRDLPAVPVVSKQPSPAPKLSKVLRGSLRVPILSLRGERHHSASRHYFSRARWTRLYLIEHNVHVKAWIICHVKISHIASLTNLPSIQCLLPWSANGQLYKLDDDDIWQHECVILWCTSYQGIKYALMGYDILVTLPSPCMWVYTDVCPN